MNENQFGFSTGALEKCDHRAALEWLVSHHLAAVELSALKLDELEPLPSDLDNVTVAGSGTCRSTRPAHLPREQEADVLEELEKVSQRGWNIIVHLM